MSVALWFNDEMCLSTHKFELICLITEHSILLSF